MIFALLLFFLSGTGEFHEVYETASEDAKDVIVTLPAPRARAIRITDVEVVCDLPCNSVFYRQAVAGSARAHLRGQHTPTEKDWNSGIFASADSAPRRGREWHSSLTQRNCVIRPGQALVIRTIGAFWNMGKVTISVGWKEQ